jgi:Pyruvate/2-oxoacid:ferredoxin oxidoreductase delta subunit
MSFRRKRSQTLEELKKSSKLPEEEIINKATTLAKNGVIFNQPNRKGVMVYRLLPFVNVGLFEYFFMKKLEVNERNKEIADLFLKMQDELRDLIQKNYDQIVPSMLKQKAIDRTLPFTTNKETGKEIEIKIDEEIEVPTEKIIPTQKIEELVEKFDDISVGHCFCRHHRDLLGKPCKQTEQRENCFTFGKSARHTSENGFGRLVSKEEALKILKDAANEGLVHKAYHPNFDTTKDETSICNCCTCCCGQAPPNLIGATINATNYRASIDQDKCVGCGTCVEHCHTGVIELNDEDKAEITGEYCIGCGTCAQNCPEDAISLVEDPRIVRIPPPRRS